MWGVAIAAPCILWWKTEYMSGIIKMLIVGSGKALYRDKLLGGYL